MQHDGTIQKMFHIIQIMGCDQNGFLSVQNGTHQLDKILAGKYILAQKGFIHQIVIGPLGKSGCQFHTCLLTRGKPCNAHIGRQAKELQKVTIAFGVKGRMQIFQKSAILPHCQVGIIAAFSGNITDPLILFGSRFSIKQSNPGFWR